MNAKTNKKKSDETFDLARAQKAAQELVEFLRPGCRQIEVAGSVRRGNVQRVHDIDLVAWAVYQDTVQPSLLGGSLLMQLGPARLVSCIRRLMIDIKTPEPDAKILRFAFRAIPVEVYLAEPDGSNYSALLQMRTGPADLNKCLALEATRRGLFYHAGYGIYEMRPGETRPMTRVDDGTEEGIFAALGLGYLPPEKRVKKALLPLKEKVSI